MTSGTAFPKYKKKHTFEPMVTPKVFFKSRSISRPKQLKTAILVYSRHMIRFAKKPLELKRYKKIYGDYLDVFLSKNKQVIMLKLGIGAPLTATVVEELSYYGINNFIILGIAGSLTKSLGINEVTICTKAVRDEGTSHHYARPSLYAYPDRQLSKQLENAVERSGLKYVKGPTWTIDAPYRETYKEVLHYRKIGILNVEMEASTLFTVAKLFKRRAAAVFTVSDVLDEEWTGMKDNRLIGYKRLVKVAATMFPQR